MISPAGSQSLYAKRRLKAFSELRPDKDLAILFNAPKHIRNNDTPFPYRADSSFFYLSGVIEEETALAFFWRKKGKTKVPTLITFARKKDPHMEQWDGEMLGVEGIQKALKSHESFAIEELGHFVSTWLMNQKRGSDVRLFTNAMSNAQNKERFFKIIDQVPFSNRRGVPAPHGIFDIDQNIQSHRLVKDAHELKILEQASQINVEAHLKLMKAIEAGMNEYEARAILEKHFLEKGCSGPSYSSICASGENATILHYQNNNATLKAGQLFLIDAGCEYQNYASDITRTYSVDGNYSKEQKSIMDLVLEAQEEGIRNCYPGNTWTKLHKNVSHCLIEGLRALKILKGTTSSIFEKGHHRKYYPHSTGHWLGLDVHDNNPYFIDGKDIPFQEGMVLTIEPGLYFLKKHVSVPKGYRGIGVRIEDDIVIQKGKKALNLTGELPKSVEDIQKL